MALRATFAAASLLLAAACAGTQGFNATLLEEVFVKDFESDEPKGCTTADVPLGHAQARAFLQRAVELDHKTLNDNYPVAPCRLVGTARYGGRACDWSISAASTGWLECGQKRRYLACDDCKDLFGR